jgi:hypothetical protein
MHGNNSAEVLVFERALNVDSTDHCRQRGAQIVFNKQ